MDIPIKKYLLISQLCLLVDLAICLILIPHFLFARNEGGMSNYGIHLKTVLPYSFGFLLAAFFVIKAALTIKAKSNRLHFMRRLLISYSILLLLILISTYGYKTNVYLKNTHIVITIATFWFELLSSAWLSRVFLWDKINIGFLVCQFIGLIIGSLTFFGSLHLLFTSQLITIISFGVILVRSSPRAVDVVI
jgi:hypothetical protein